MRILLTEDEPVLADLIVEFLRDEGHDVTLVSDLELAGELVCAKSWHAWVVDPSGNGFAEPDRDCAAALRRLAPVVPIVVTTGRLWGRRTTPADLGVRAILNKALRLERLAAHAGVTPHRPLTPEVRNSMRITELKGRPVVDRASARTLGRIVVRVR